MVRPPPATGTWPSPPAPPAPTSWTSTTTARPETATPRLGRLHRAGLLDGAAAYVRTPSGGLHAYFAGSHQRNGHLPAHHLDFRSAGGYVLAPPSQVDGHPYLLMREPGGRGTLDWAAVTRLLPRTPAAARTPGTGPRTADLDQPGPLGRRASPKATATPACTGPPTAPWKPTPPPT